MSAVQGTVRRSPVPQGVRVARPARRRVPSRSTIQAASSANGPGVRGRAMLDVTISGEGIRWAATHHDGEGRACRSRVDRGAFWAARWRQAEQGRGDKVPVHEFSSTGESRPRTLDIPVLGAASLLAAAGMSSRCGVGNDSAPIGRASGRALARPTGGDEDGVRPVARLAPWSAGCAIPHRPLPPGVANGRRCREKCRARFSA